MEGESYSKLSIKKKKSDQPIYFGIDIETGEYETRIVNKNK
jgi:hypothetical protein